MPADYLAIKASLLKEGKSLKEAERIAAATHNKHHPNNPVGPHTDNHAAVEPQPLEFDKDAPAELQGMYKGSYDKCRQAGKEHPDAHKRAVNEIQNAGWYKGQGGWKQLHQDLRDKLTSREAIKQADGKYLIEDVPVFYPNAVKGPQLKFPADDIRQIIDNTNRGVEAGGQKPAILEGHTVPEHTLLGKQMDAHGFAVNWREDSRRPGWARCDMIGVDPAYVQRMKDKRLTGLSAGIARDSEGLNKRFGHVALLGGTTQALSLLPALDIHSSSAQVCFSADEHLLKGPKMKRLNPKHKAKLDAMMQAYSAYGSACAAMEAGEPGADSKMNEACSGLESAHKNYWGEDSYEKPQIEEETPTSDEPERVEEDPDPSTEYDGSGPMPLNNMPSKGSSGVAPMSYESLKGLNFADDPKAAFDALRDISLSQFSEITELKNTNEALRKINNSMIGKMTKNEFDSEVTALKAAGVTLPDNLDQQFQACFDHKNPKRALEILVAGLRSMPKAQTPGTTETLFAEDGNTPVPGRPKPKTAATAADVASITRELTNNRTSQNFAADGDLSMKWAAIGASLSA